jgi:hypothetical protein
LKKKPKKKPSTSLINADTTVYDLVATDVLDVLTHAELIVFLRLLVADEKYGSARMPVVNRELHADPRTVGRALSRLQARRIVSVSFDAAGARTIEVLR